MSDYIKREDAITAIDGTITIIGIENAIAVRQLINQFNVKLKIIPPADVVERKSGRWKLVDTYKDHHGRIVDRMECDCGFIWHREMGFALYNFCPNCGVDMRGMK